MLVISGERKQENVQEDKKVKRIERSYGSFERRFRLPATVKEGEIKAKLSNGVLNVRVPSCPSRLGCSYPRSAPGGHRLSASLPFRGGTACCCRTSCCYCPPSVVDGHSRFRCFFPLLVVQVLVPKSPEAAPKATSIKIEAGEPSSSSQSIGSGKQPNSQETVIGGAQADA